MSNNGLSDREVAMFSELADVMKKYNDIERKFNIALDHQHFEIADDESLYETHDAKTRVLKTVVVKDKELSGSALATQWKLPVISPDISVVSWCCDDSPIP